MFKNFKKNDKYLSIALYTFFVIAACILLIFLFLNIYNIFNYIKDIIGAFIAFIYGFAIAYICNPLYKRIHTYVFKFVEKKKPHPKLRKAFSLLLTYIVFLGFISLIFIVMIPQISKNVETLTNNISEYINNIENWATSTLNKLHEIIPSIDPDKVLNSITGIFESDGEFSLSEILNFSNIFNIGSTAVMQIFSFIVGIILSIYFLIYKDSIVSRLKRILCSVFKKEKYEAIIDFFRFTDKTFGRYIIGAVLDSTLVGITIFITLTIVKIPFAPLIGLVCGFTNIIPFFGPFLGAIPSGILILIAGEPYQVILFAVIILITQQIDGNIIAPHILGSSTGLTPIGVIAAVTICSHLFGFVGMVIGVPLCAVVSWYIQKFIVNKLKKKRLPSDLNLYEVPDIYKDDKFMKEKYELEAKYRLSRIEEIDKIKNELIIEKSEIEKAEAVIKSQQKESIAPEQVEALIDSNTDRDIPKVDE